MTVIAKVGTEFPVETWQAGIQSAPTITGLNNGDYPYLNLNLTN